MRAQQQDSLRSPTGVDTLRFPIIDRRGDRYTERNRNPLDLHDPLNITDSIVYDPKTRQYYIVEKVGGFYYRKPTYLTFDEYLAIRGKQQEREYFRQEE